MKVTIRYIDWDSKETIEVQTYGRETLQEIATAVDERCRILEGQKAGVLRSIYPEVAEASSPAPMRSLPEIQAFICEFNH